MHDIDIYHIKVLTKWHFQMFWVFNHSSPALVWVIVFKKNVWLNDFWVLCSFAFETSAQSSGVICTWYGGRVHDVINIVAHWVKNLVNYACDTNSWGSILITETGVDCCMTGLILLVTGEGVWWKSGEWCVWMMPSLWSWIWGDIWWP